MGKAEVITQEEQFLAPIKERNRYMLADGFIEEKQLLHILQRTPKEHVYTRPAKGGGTWQYVTGTYIKKILNYVFGWNWDFEIVSKEVLNGSVVIQGRLSVRANGVTVVKEQFGRAEIKMKGEKPLDIGNDYKAAATDALKKCAAELGIASDIYGKNEFRDIKAKPKEIAKTTKDWNKTLQDAVIFNQTETESFEDCFDRLFPNTEYPDTQVGAQKLVIQLLRKD